MQTTDVWPAGATWVFQGTVAEDATAGTHVSSLTVTPGAGNEMELLYGSIIVGATATAQVLQARTDDGTNTLNFILESVSTTSSGLRVSFPQSTAAPASATANSQTSSYVPIIISGAMRLILQVSTTAVSVTQTFAVACRPKTSALPTATLADSVGVPTLTTNTNRVF